jgi:hypothetical protein
MGIGLSSLRRAMQEAAAVSPVAAFLLGGLGLKSQVIFTTQLKLCSFK